MIIELLISLQGILAHSAGTDKLYLLKRKVSATFPLLTKGALVSHFVEARFAERLLAGSEADHEFVVDFETKAAL